MDYATYNPEDDKIRIYPAARLSPEDYATVKGAGFQWAPMQKCFYAVWSPDREDVAEAFAGDLEDESTSLAERAAERAERFEGYRANRARDAEQAHRAVSAIADNIPLGQPILVGHHSERRARKDAERIENGMRRAVKAWKTSEYWRARAAGALAHADYKERPDVRHRRIKGLESDRRKMIKSKEQAERGIAAWSVDGLTWERARALANYCHASQCFPVAEYPRLTPEASPYEGPMGIWSALEGIITPEQARDIVVAQSQHVVTRCDRWLEHLDNRLTFERAMLADAGGLGIDRAAIPVQVGGRVRIGTEWLTVIRLNRSAGALVSVTTNARYCRVRGIETIAEVEAPKPETVKAIKAKLTQAPLCNYPGEGFDVMTKADWERTYRDYKGTRTVPATAEHAAHRVRSRVKGHSGILCVYISDMPTKYPPAAPEPDDQPEAAPMIPPPERDLAAEATRQARRAEARAEQTPAAVQGMVDTLKAGVQVFSAPQLFPTPPDLAARMARMAQLRPGVSVLEPSAGTGRLVDAIKAAEPSAAVFMVECNHRLAERLSQQYTAQDAAACVNVLQGDFLEMSPGQIGPFDRVVMNPPYENGVDIRHIQRARAMTTRDGLLVALCAGGPRQEAALRPEALTWERLPSGTFDGTGVQAVLLTMRGLR